MKQINLDKLATILLEPAPRAWTLAFLLNLPVPFGFACEILIDGGFLGLLYGLLLIYVVGWRLSHSRPSLIRTIARGGYMVAATQIFPVLQMIVGLFAVMISAQCVHNLARGADPNTDLDLFFLDEPFGGFMATVATGSALLLIALVLGLLLDRLSPTASKPKPPPPEL